ncbi:SLAC1 anion channel family protein [Vibrio sp. SCSIO 43137]|uniref:SLAC1 anion channel family protein n=1 Tax=Vibrio sp. SCSIO 43137 TaxID=3021011 RepID=UPI002308100F|nr:SLAC1 anion channel family protein [Vibrio sp. SCSIO 43137]WCE28664.1 SLAC1 anion channel family protein [Vibrio sp. SCSIO 43137]
MSSETVSEQQNAVEKLVHFPISFFAVVMGLSGLTLAWRAAGSDILPTASFWLGLFTSLVMLAVTILYTIKIVRYPEAVIAESRHPIRLNFFPAFSISLLLLAVVWQDYHSLSHTLWIVGAAVQICLTVYVISSWIHHTHYTLSHANPSWFIPVVGNIIAPIAGSHLGYFEISWFFFSVGIVFWVVLLTIVMYRLFFHEPLPARLTPMLFILLAPPSVGFVSYTNLVGELDVFARVIYYVGLFLCLVLVSNILRFAKVPFFISSWAYSFPLAALTIATAKMSGFVPTTFFNALSGLLLTLVTLLLSWLVLRTIKAILNDEICVPE